MPRLFTGIEIPPAISMALTSLRGGLNNARWVDPENYHLTLRFIGDVENPVANEVANMLDEVAREPFTLRFEGLGAFGGRKPHAVYVALAPSPDLMALQAEHERLMQRVGLQPEGRKYTPHLTLARVRGIPPEVVARYIELRAGFSAGPFNVSRFALFSARAGQGGGPYVVEEAYPLTGRQTVQKGDATWQTG